jgi:thiol-disulfide isomerase/thioredoxin
MKQFCFFILFLFWISSTISASTGYIEELEVGDLAPDFNITNVHTNTSSKLSDHLGKVVILDLWATWCPPCKESVPEIIRLQKSYNTSDLQIISIDIDHSESYKQIIDFALNYNMSWIVSMDISNMRLNYSTGRIPTMYIIDKQGYIVYKEIGFKYNYVTEALDALITADNIAPIIINPQITQLSTPMSFENNSVKVQAENITDEFSIEEIFLLVSSGSAQGIYNLIQNSLGEIDAIIEIRPSLLFGTDHILLSIVAKDFRGNEAQSIPLSLSVELIDLDTSPPEIISVDIEFENLSTIYRFSIEVTVYDDTFVDYITISLKEPDQVQNFQVKDISRSDDNSSIFVGVLSLNKTEIITPEFVIAEVTAVDVAGKETHFSSISSTSNKITFFWGLHYIFVSLGILAVYSKRKK